MKILRNFFNILTKLPENLEIYKSMLFMSICRGDLPAAYIAYKYISSLSPPSHSYSIFSSILWKASAFHFSALPLEVVKLEGKNIWNIISGMCNSCIDKRALSLFLMLSYKSSAQKSKLFKKWLDTNQILIRNFTTFEDKMIHSAITYLNQTDGILAEDFFSYNATPVNKVLPLTKIEPMYLLGSWSWFYKHIDNSLRIIYNSSNISNIIYLFEINKIMKKIDYINYWEDAKFSILGAQCDYLEDLWNDKLQPYTRTLLNEMSEMRLPLGL